MDNDKSLVEKDHKRIGQELDLFVFSSLVGPGLPLWTPRGTILREQLDGFVQEMRNKYNYKAVYIPHITKKDLYEKSGHWAKFSEELFSIKRREGHEFAVKPMSCPHHTQIYAARPRSYRELPIRYRETTMCYRDEQTGELNGILRPRAFAQDDSHVFCREEHILDEVLAIWEIIEKFYKTLDFKLDLRFSTRDPKSPEGYAGTEEKWQSAEAEMRKAIEKKGAKAGDGTGDAAFYGPKLDFMSTDSLGREWQVATIQLDFAQPEGLDLTYIDKSGKEQRPVMIHCAVMGSIERFLGVYLEHSGGKFPLWLAPEQLRVTTLNDDQKILDAARQLVEQAQERGIRIEIDDSDESVGKKVRDAEHMKVPYTIVIGNKEVESGQVTPRVRSDLPKLDKETWAIDEFLAKLSEDAKARK
jgi:threonyl-tRNA synthetase